MPGSGVLDEIILKMEVGKFREGRRKRSESAEPYLRQHPLSAGLHAETTIVHPQDEIGSLLVAALPHVKFGFVRRRRGEISVQTEFDSHAAGLSEKLNKGAPANAANTYVADVCPRPGVIRFPPVNETSERLDDLNRFPTLGEGTDSEIICELLAGSVNLGLEELGTGHEEGGEQERTPRSDVMDGVEGWVEKIDEGVQTQEDEVEEDGGLILIHDSSCDRIWS